MNNTNQGIMFGINSFGFGGSNAHAVIQQYKKPIHIESNHVNINNIIMGHKYNCNKFHI